VRRRGRGTEGEGKRERERERKRESERKRERERERKRENETDEHAPACQVYIPSKTMLLCVAVSCRGVQPDSVCCSTVQCVAVSQFYPKTPTIYQKHRYTRTHIRTHTSACMYLCRFFFQIRTRTRTHIRTHTFVYQINSCTRTHIRTHTSEHTRCNTLQHIFGRCNTLHNIC